MIRQKGKKLALAAVTVELAVVSPVMFAMLFGIIEFGWLFTVRHTMVNAAREGARVGAIQGTDASDVEARVIELLAPMGLEDKVTIAITEATTDEPNVSVLLTVPQANVSLVGNFFGFEQGTISAFASMRREGM
ncbi:MAG: pilus assembly protein [Phycisphaerae bacterium]